MFIRIDSVAGMIAAAPTPIRARAAISSLALPDIAAQQRPAAEDQQAEHQETAPAEAVTERAAHQEQAGEDEQIAVDDPLRLAGVDVEVGAQRRAARR